MTARDTILILASTLRAGDDFIEGTDGRIFHAITVTHDYPRDRALGQPRTGIVRVTTPDGPKDYTFNTELWVLE